MTPLQLKQRRDAFCSIPELAIAVTQAKTEEGEPELFNVEIWKGGGATNVSVLVPIEAQWCEQQDFERRYISEAIETLLNDGVSEADFEEMARQQANQPTDVEPRMAALELMQ